MKNVKLSPIAQEVLDVIASHSGMNVLQIEQELGRERGDREIRRAVIELNTKEQITRKTRGTDNLTVWIVL